MSFTLTFTELSQASTQDEIPFISYHPANLLHTHTHFYPAHSGHRSDPACLLNFSLNKIIFETWSCKSDSYVLIFQDLLATLPFSQIMHWVSGPTFFNLTVGDSTAFSKLMLETSLAYKMDDLLTSYIAHVLASTDKQKQGPKKPQ